MEAHHKYVDVNFKDAINTSTKNCQNIKSIFKVENFSANEINFSNQIKDTFLFKLLTRPGIPQNNSQVSNFSCRYCKQIFSNTRDLENHQNFVMNKSNRAVCCACKKTFGQIRYLRSHLKLHSKDINVNKFKCNHCSKTYSRLGNLYRHNFDHSNSNKFSCDFVKFVFGK